MFQWNKIMALPDTSSKYYCGSNEQNWNKNPSAVPPCSRFAEQGLCKVEECEGIFGRSGCYRAMRNKFLIVRNQ